MFYADYYKNRGPYGSLDELLDATRNEIKYYLHGVVRYNLWYRDIARRSGVDAIERVLLNECRRLADYPEALAGVRDSLEREPISEEIDLFYWPKNGILEGENFSISLESMEKAVEVYGSSNGSVISRRKEFKQLGDGVHVAEVYERYPCFDSEDYACENRYFENYFTSKEPVSDEAMKLLQNLKNGGNARLLTESTPARFLPAVYYKGEGELMIVGLPVPRDE